MNTVKFNPFRKLHLDTDFKLNICTLRFIPELGSHLFCCPKPPTFFTLLCFSRIHSQALTQASHMFCAYTQRPSVSEHVLLLPHLWTDFNTKLEILWIYRLFTRSWLYSTAISIKTHHKSTSETTFLSIYQVLQPSTDKRREYKRVCYWTIKNIYSWCSSHATGYVTRAENLDQTEFLYLCWNYDWCSTITSCKHPITLLRRIQSTIFYGEDNDYD